MASTLETVAELFHPAMFWMPEITVVSAWPEHIPFAFWLTAAHRPRKFVELGTHTGASYFAFCQAIDRLSLSTVAYAIDTWQGDEQAGRYGEEIFQGVSNINGKYTSFSTLVRSTFDDALEYFEDGEIDLLHIDGLHTYDAVKHDFETWLPLLSDRAIVVLHDTNVRRDNFGVFKFFEEAAQKYPSFNFHHGHGLGVLAVGENQNETLKKFFDMANDENKAGAIRLTFSRLGMLSSQKLHIKHLEDLYAVAHGEISTKEAERNRLKIQADQLDTEAHALRADLASADQHRAHLEAMINEINCENKGLAARLAQLDSEADALLKRAIAANEVKLEMEIALAESDATFVELTNKLETEIADRHKMEALFETASKERDHLKNEKIAAFKVNFLSKIMSRLKYGKPNTLFDAKWYLSTYDDVLRKKYDPWEHFVRWGAKEGRWPNAMFAPHWYLERYPEVQASEMNPLVHYWKYGAKNGLDPHPSFSSSFYLSTNKDVAEAAMNPLLHYLKFGTTEGRATSPSVEGRGQQTAVAKQQAGRIDPNFQPGSGLEYVSENGEHFWKMDNNDPFFLSDAKIKKGIYRFVISGAEKSSLLINLKLYYDVGNGFSEKEAVDLGYVKPEQKLVFFIEFPSDVVALRLDPSERRGTFRFSEIYFEKLARLSPDWFRAVRSRLMRQGKGTASHQDEIGSYVNSMYKAAAAIGPVSVDDLAPIWISIVVPVYDAKTRYLDDILKSFVDQGIAGAELILVDDCSPSNETRQWLAQRQASRPDLKIVFSEKNGGISAATNLGIKHAEGEWLTLLDHDDLIAPHALKVIARAIKQKPDAQFFYTDEIHVNDVLQPQDVMLKPAYDPILISGVNYINHFSIYRRDRLNEIGGLRIGYEGSQDYDLLLRYLNSLEDKDILHIPYPAYWWRRAGETFSMKFIEQSTQNARKAIQDIYREKGIDCELREAISPNLHKIEFFNPKQPKISIIIPNRNSFNLMKTVLSGIFENTSYKNFEVIVIDNGSNDEKTLGLYNDYQSKYKEFQSYVHVEQFNFSRSINKGMKLATGEVFLMLNNDIEVIHKEWLSEMVSCLNYEGVGIVGAKLLYPDDLIQHAGVVMGLGGLAGHWYLRKDSEYGGPLNRLHVRSSMVCVTGAAMLITRECAEQIGDWDEENFAVAFNDVDYCVRAYQNGFRVVWTPFASLYHHESVSRGSDETGENRIRFQKECDNLRRIHSADRFLDPAINPAYSIDRSCPRVVEMDNVPDARHWFPAHERGSL